MRAAPGGRLRWPDALQFLRDILLGLLHIHTNNFLHLDVHPFNVMVPRSHVAVLTDLGSAQRAQATLANGSRVYVGPMRGGRWVYCPPEQICSEPKYSHSLHPALAADQPPLEAKAVVFDASVDTFSAAACAVFMLTGRPPFLPAWLKSEKDGKIRERDVLKHALRHRTAMRACLREASPDAPSAFIDAMVQALDELPRYRFSSVQAFLDALVATDAAK